MFISLSKARSVDKLLCLMFAGRVGRTANAEHQRKQRWHIYVVYGPPSQPVCLICHAGHVRGLGS
jgi:hypothetical protein